MSSRNGRVVLQNPERTLVLLAASTGLRQSELLRLKWGDINFAEGTMNVARSNVCGVVGPCKTESSTAIDARRLYRIKPTSASKEITFTFLAASRSSSSSTASGKKDGSLSLRPSMTSSPRHQAIDSATKDLPNEFRAVITCRPPPKSNVLRSHLVQIYPIQEDRVLASPTIKGEQFLLAGQSDEALYQSGRESERYPQEHRLAHLRHAAEGERGRL